MSPMPRAPECPSCRTTLDAGYVLDNSRNMHVPATWVADPPEKGFLGSLKTKGHEQAQVMAFRCPKCRRLELYAP